MAKKDRQRKQKGCRERKIREGGRERGVGDREREREKIEKVKVNMWREEGRGGWRSGGVRWVI